MEPGACVSSGLCHILLSQKVGLGLAVVFDTDQISLTPPQWNCQGYVYCGILILQSLAYGIEACRVFVCSNLFCPKTGYWPQAFMLLSLNMSADGKIGTQMASLHYSET